MTDAATVVWLDPAPSADDKATLAEWARARGVSLHLPRDGGVSVIGVDPSLAGAVEADLQLARDAIAKLDAKGAEAALSRAEHALHDHPELPQGAWLMAEVERGWSARWARLEPKSDERAAEAWAHARALDGGRAPGVGERAFASTEQPVVYTLLAETPSDAKLVWDGSEITAGPASALEGVHQLRVEAAGHTLFASWISITTGTVVRVAVPGPAPCSARDLAGVHASGGAIVASGVRCERWIAASPHANGSIAVATCSRDVCGSANEWRTPALANLVAPAVEHHFTWPAWGTWTIIGVGVLASVGVALGAAGVFAPPSATTRFVQGGIKTESLRAP